MDEVDTGERYNRTDVDGVYLTFELAAIKTVLPLKEAVTPEGTVVDEGEQSKNKTGSVTPFFYDMRGKGMKK